MADLNQYSFTGRLGGDAKVNKTSNGKSVMDMSVAVTSGFGDYKKTIWVKVKQWGDRVNNIAPIFTKGSIVAGTGEVSLEEWQGKDGLQHTGLVVTCMSVQLLHKKDSGQPQEQPNAFGPPPADDEEIPF